MSSLIDRGGCPMRHENGNCTAAGGFCTAVNDPICEALHNAFNCGEQSRYEWATLALAEQTRLFEEKQLKVLREIKEKVSTPVIRCKDCKHWKTEDDHCTNLAGLCATGVKARNNYCVFGERKDGE